MTQFSFEILRCAQEWAYMPAIAVRVVMRLPQVLAHLRNDGSGGIEIATGAYAPFVIHNI